MSNRAYAPDVRPVSGHSSACISSQLQAIETCACGSSSDDRTELGKLRKLKGPDFDREFARAMVTDHQTLIDQLTDARARTTDSDLRGLIDKLLPTFQQHLSMAQKLQILVSKA